jgi:hypothetical protein
MFVIYSVKDYDFRQHIPKHLAQSHSQIKFRSSSRFDTNENSSKNKILKQY